MKELYNLSKKSLRMSQTAGNSTISLKNVHHLHQYRRKRQRSRNAVTVRRPMKAGNLTKVNTRGRAINVAQGHERVEILECEKLELENVQSRTKVEDRVNGDVPRLTKVVAQGPTKGIAINGKGRKESVPGRILEKEIGQGRAIIEGHMIDIEMIREVEGKAKNMQKVTEIQGHPLIATVIPRSQVNLGGNISKVLSFILR